MMRIHTIHSRPALKSMARASSLLLAAVLGSCSEGPLKPASLVATSSVEQSAVVGSTVTPPPSVKVLDEKGNPVAGFPIVFAVTSGNGTLSRTADTTDENGVATSGAWTIGTTVGANVVTASGQGLEGSPLSFTVTGTAAAPASIAVEAGDNQTAAVGAAVAVRPSVIVRDQYFNPVPSIPVTFTVSAGDGSVGTATVNTNASGVATLSSWTLGTTAGVNQLAVTADGTPGVTLTATGQPGSVSGIVIQRQPSGAASGNVLARQPVIRLADAYGNLVAGASATVTVAIATGPGTLTGTQTIASSNGVATFTDLVVTGAGPTTLIFTASGLGTPVTSSSFTVAAAAGPAAQLVVGTQPGSAVSAMSLTTQPDVEVRDASGVNVTTGTHQVTATLSSANGILTGTTTVTTVNGVATFTDLAVLGSGSYTIDFTATGLTGTSSSTVNVAAPQVAGLELVAGNRQAGYAGEPVLTKPAIRVLGPAKQPVPGARVTFAAALGGGSVTGGSVISDANGVATIGDWNLGSAATFNTLTATVEGIGVPGNPVTLEAAGCSPGDGATGYKLSVCFVSVMSTSQRAAFTAAADRWSSVITKDLEDYVFQSQIPEGFCGSTTYAVPAGMKVDDLLIFAAITPIDGLGKIGGSAGPCIGRTLPKEPGTAMVPGELPVLGQMVFDEVDVGSIESGGALVPLITHEMGHVLGIGILWSPMGLLKNPSPPGAPTDTYMNGAGALQGFTEIGFGSYSGSRVPVENLPTVAIGSLNSHWRESVLPRELMSSVMNSSPNAALTALTIRSLADMGYTVTTVGADPYPSPPASLSTAPAKIGGKTIAPINLGDDTYKGPLYTIDRLGRVRRIR